MLRPRSDAEAANIGGGVIDGLGRVGVLRRLLVGFAASAPAADRHRGGGAEIGARRHRCKMAGIEDIGPGARRPCPARAHIGDDGDGRSQDGAHDVPHRGVEAAGRIHAQDDERGAAAGRLGEALVQIFAGGRPDRAVDVEQDRRAAGAGIRTAIFGVRHRHETEAEQDDDPGGEAGQPCSTASAHANDGHSSALSRRPP